MKETICSVDYFSIEIPNKPGEATRILDAVRKAEVNLLAFSAFPSGKRCRLDFFPADTLAFVKAASQAGLKISPRKTGFLIQGEDRVGAIADILGKLAEAKITVTAVDAICAGANRYGAILWVKPPDQKRAAEALGITEPKLAEIEGEKPAWALPPIKKGKRNGRLRQPPGKASAKSGAGG